ncbi:MAG TPA: hypothetical protein VL485_08700 [Ktedonobacteraceae bacterium]|jgi:hypothetical protein|nr:hypothetical protein [Ktedonobacteraceae bacterium]
MPQLKKSLHAIVRKKSRPEDLSFEVEQLLDVLARIEARRQLRLRALGGKPVNATSKTPS